MIPTIIQLAATKTYEFRIASWTPVHPRLAPSLGVMTITEAVNKTSKRYTNRYATMEMTSDMGRSFKVTKAKGVESYYTLIAKIKTEDQCTCVGFLAGGYCKHVEAIRALVEKGAMNSSNPRTYPLTMWSEAEEPKTTEV